MEVFQHPADERHGFAGMAGSVIAVWLELFMQATQFDLRIDERADKLPQVRRSGATKGEYFVYKLPVGRIQFAAVAIAIYKAEKFGFRKYKKIHSHSVLGCYTSC